MNHLIIYSHPNKESLNHHLLQTVVDALQTGEHTVEIRDLYQLVFNPVLSLEDLQGQRRGEVTADVKAEHEYLLWAEHVTFIYPIWWTGMPAIMKGYIDRVLSYGFAYRYDQGVQKGLLTGRATTIINTHGKSVAEYQSIGMDKALALTSDKGIFTYCGLEINRHFFFDKADRALAERVLEWEKEIKGAY